MFVRVGFALVLMLIIVIVLVTMIAIVMMPFSMMMVMVMIVMMVVMMMVMIMMIVLVIVIVVMLVFMLMFMPMIMVVPVVVVVMMMMVLMGMRMLGRNMRMACFPFRDILVHRTDDDPQHVRSVRQIAGSGSVPDGLDDHRRQPFGEVVYDAGDDPGPRRRSHLHRIVGRGDRQAAHHLERSRCRNRV